MGVYRLDYFDERAESRVAASVGARASSMVQLQLWMSNAQSRFALQLGLVFRQRLLFGTLRLKPDEIRQQGLGQFLERVMMAEQIENLAVGGGLLAFLALFEYRWRQHGSWHKVRAVCSRCLC